MCHVDEYDKVAKVLYRTPVQFSEILKKITLSASVNIFLPILRFVTFESSHNYCLV